MLLQDNFMEEILCQITKYGAGKTFEMQKMIEEKTNEITAIPEIIERLNLKNVICT